MEIFSAEFLSALLVILLIDLVLAGDNALVIALAARNVPKHRQRVVIFWGTVGAIGIRVVMTLGVYWLLKIPGLALVGGLALVWIARKLLVPGEGHESSHGMAAASSVGGAIRTIVIADAVMGIDNALAIGAAARESVLLIILGLAITVPIIVWGSRVVLAMVGRFPSIILLGGAVIGWTAAKMILEEPLLQGILTRGPAVEGAVTLLILVVSVLPWFQDKTKPEARKLLIALPFPLAWLVGFEVASELWDLNVGYLDAGSLGDALLQLLRWTGWLPITALGLWIAERRARDAAADKSMARASR
jgi:YjbE family integral membrane protein